MHILPECSILSIIQKQGGKNSYEKMDDSAIKHRDFYYDIVDRRNDLHGGAAGSRCDGSVR